MELNELGFPVDWCIVHPYCGSDRPVWKPERPVSLFNMFSSAVIPRRYYTVRTDINEFLFNDMTNKISWTMANLLRSGKFVCYVRGDNGEAYVWWYGESEQWAFAFNDNSGYSRTKVISFRERLEDIFQLIVGKPPDNTRIHEIEVTARIIPDGLALP